MQLLARVSISIPVTFAQSCQTRRVQSCIWRLRLLTEISHYCDRSPTFRPTVKLIVLHIETSDSRILLNFAGSLVADFVVEFSNARESHPELVPLLKLFLKPRHLP